MTRSAPTATASAAAAPDHVGWVSCPDCGWLLYRKRLDRNLHVCPECDHHLRLSARARIVLLTDPGSFTETTFPPGPTDPLSFTDLRDYPDRLADAARRSGESEAVVVGVARIGGVETVVAVMDFAFLGGSMGVEVGRRVSGADDADRDGSPVDVAVDDDPWDVVQRARVVERPTTLDYLHTAFDDFVELHGDRAFADDPAVVGGIASIGGRTVVVVGQEKGHTVRERIARNFGMPHPEGYRKAQRLLDHAEAFGLPVVTLVDTPGAHPGPEAEERGQSHAIAEIIMRSSRLRVPVVSVVTGEGGSGGALALCTSDRLLVLQNAYLSVISPEGCAAILWRTAVAAPTAARAMRLGAAHLRASGIATSVVAEPPGGAHTDPAEAARLLRRALVRELDDVCRLDVATLLDTRSRRLERIGGDDDRPLQPVEG
jgi:acetyl-CoA carboxylase carboxyl transferase alpha subunit